MLNVTPTATEHLKAYFQHQPPSPLRIFYGAGG